MTDQVTKFTLTQLIDYIYIYTSSLYILLISISWMHFSAAGACSDMSEEKRRKLSAPASEPCEPSARYYSAIHKSSHVAMFPKQRERV